MNPPSAQRIRPVGSASRSGPWLPRLLLLCFALAACHRALPAGKQDAVAAQRDTDTDGQLTDAETAQPDSAPADNSLGDLDGISLDTTTETAGVDTGPADAEPPPYDAVPPAPGCTPTACNDGNACTDDAKSADGLCGNTANEGACVQRTCDAASDGTFTCCTQACPGATGGVGETWELVLSATSYGDFRALQAKANGGLRSYRWSNLPVQRLDVAPNGTPVQLKTLGPEPGMPQGLADGGFVRVSDSGAALAAGAEAWTKLCRFDAAGSQVWCHDVAKDIQPLTKETFVNTVTELPGGLLAWRAIEYFWTVGLGGLSTYSGKVHVGVVDGGGKPVYGTTTPWTCDTTEGAGGFYKQAVAPLGPAVVATLCPTPQTVIVGHQLTGPKPGEFHFVNALPGITIEAILPPQGANGPELLVAGRSPTPGQQAHEDVPHVARVEMLSDTLVVKWATAIDTGEWYGRVHALTATPDGGLVLAGWMSRQRYLPQRDMARFIDYGSSAWLWRIGGDGKLLWDRPLRGWDMDAQPQNYEFANVDWPTNEIRTPFIKSVSMAADGGLLLTGGEKLTKFNLDGPNLVPPDWLARTDAWGRLTCGAVDKCQGVRTATDCGDANPCTLDLCLAAQGCVHPVVTDGSACGPLKGLGSETGATCKAGLCVKN